MQMVQGKAFAIGDEGNQIPTRKHWAVINNRSFLVEEIDFAALAPLMQNLPAPAADPNGSPMPIRHRLLPRDLPPKSLLAKKGSGGLKLAQKPTRERGLVLDYNIVTSSANYVFAGDTTYLVTGTVNLTGTTTFESTVIKFSATNSPSLNCSGAVTCLSTDYRPLNFLASDDNSLGQAITGSTGTPTNNNYGTVFLSLTPGTNPVSMRNLRFCNAKIALAVTGGSSNVFSHVQMVNCQNGVSATNTTFALRNALFNNVLTNFTGSSSTGRVEQLTVDTAGWLNNNIGTNLYLTNCLLVAVTNAGTFSSNSVYSVSSPSGIFQSLGAGTHYLATNSVYRNAGTTNINPVLLAQLTNLTTYPPLWLTNTFTNATTFCPVVQRETGDAPDIGWHYEALDYLASCAVSNAVLTFTNGVALGYYNSAGVNARESSQVVSQGTPNQKNYFAYFLLVQEQPINSLSQSNAVSAALSISVQHTNDLTRNPAVFLQFTALSAPVGASYVWFSADPTFKLASLTLQDCEIYSSGSTWYMGETVNVPVVLFVNNFFPRPALMVETTAQVTTYNNLYTGATNDTAYFANFGATSWTNKDNAYDGVDSYMDGSISNNAYLNGGIRESTLQSNDIVTNLTWVIGPLGSYYQPTNSPLINKGSTTADQLGLSDFTVTTNEVKESNSVVDIGYHYAVLGANGLPFPSISIVAPTNNSTYTAPANVTISASASDSQGISKVEFFYGTNSTAFATVTTPTSGLYTYTWSSATNGTYPIYAEAINNKGEITQSAVVVFDVFPSSGFPTVAITSPTNGTTSNAWSTVTVDRQGLPSLGNCGGGFLHRHQFCGQRHHALRCGRSHQFSIDLERPRAGNLHAHGAGHVRRDMATTQSESSPVYLTGNSAKHMTCSGYWDPIFGDINNVAPGPCRSGRRWGLMPPAIASSAISRQRCRGQPSPRSIPVAPGVCRWGARWARRAFWQFFPTAPTCIWAGPSTLTFRLTMWRSSPMAPMSLTWATDFNLPAVPTAIPSSRPIFPFGRSM